MYSLVDRHNWIVTIHGCNVQSQQVYLGGLNYELKEYVKIRYRSKFPVANDGHKYGGVHLGIFVIWVSIGLVYKLSWQYH